MFNVGTPSLCHSSVLWRHLFKAKFDVLLLLLLRQIAEVNVKLELKKKDIEKLVERDTQQWAAFRESIGDSKFTEFLTRVYKKKIKRSRKQATDGQGLNL